MEFFSEYDESSSLEQHFFTSNSSVHKSNDISVPSFEELTKKSISEKGTSATITTSASKQPSNKKKKKILPILHQQILNYNNDHSTTEDLFPNEQVMFNVEEKYFREEPRNINLSLDASYVVPPSLQKEFGADVLSKVKIINVEGEKGAQQEKDIKKISMPETKVTFDKPSTRQKQKHQINYLAYEVQVHAAELLEKSSKRQAKKQAARARYGW